MGELTEECLVKAGRCVAALGHCDYLPELRILVTVCCSTFGELAIVYSLRQLLQF